MLKTHRKLLLKKRVELVKDLEPNEIVGYLFQERILTENDVDLIKAEKTRRSRAELFLNTIPRKGPKAFTEFVKILQQNVGTRHLVGILHDSHTGSDEVDSASKKHEEGKRIEATDGSTDRYPMTHTPRGTCLIINNKEFVGNISDRIGSDIDARNLKELFSSLNFTTRIVKNASVEDMKRLIWELASMDHVSTDCLIVCLLSHGVSGKIYGSDGELIPLSELLNPLLRCEDNPELANKPKLFFIQACRVSKVVTVDASEAEKKKIDTFEVVRHGDPSCTAKQTSPNEAQESSELFVQDVVAPMQANILMSYSTLPGQAAWRNFETGSWFVDALVDVFKKYVSQEDILSMLIKVNDAVSKRISSISQSRQIPAPIVTLTKKLYLKV